MKNNTIIVILAVLLAGAFIAAGILAFKLNTTRTELDSSRQRVDQLRSSVTDLNTRAARLPIEERNARQCARELETVKQTLTRQLTAARESRQISEKQVLELQQDLQEMQTHLADARDKASRAEDRVVSCEQQITGLKKEKSDLENAAAQSQETAAASAQKIDHLSGQIGRLKTLVETKNHEMDQISAKNQTLSDSLEEKITTLETKISALETRNSILIVQKAQAETQAAELNKRIADLEAGQGDLIQAETELQTANDTIAQLKADVTAANEKIDTLQARLKAALDELESTLQKIVSLKEIGAACQAALQEEQAHLAKNRTELHAALTEIEHLKNEAAEQTEQKATLADISAQLAAANVQLAEIDTALEQKNAQVKTLNQALAEANDKITGYEARLSTVFGTKSRIEKEFQRFKQTHTSLITDLEQQIKNREITVDRLKEQITITFIDQILFSSGRASLNPKGKKALDKVGRILLEQAQGREIRVVGHTDNLPIHPAIQYRFPTNWELSAHRATSVVRYLQQKTGLDPGDMSAVGRSFFEPVAGNDTPEGRARNRRVEIIIAPKL